MKYRVFIILASRWVLCLSDCITYGDCGKNEYGNSRTCRYNGPARQLGNEMAIRDLRKLCPWYFTGTDNPEVCCSPGQVATMKSMANLPQMVVSRCPACWRNLRTFMCARACSPQMSEFEAVLQTVPFVNQDGVVEQSVNSTYLAVNYHYMDSIMKSCANVSFLGSSALIAICMSSSCTPDLLVASLSNPQIGAPHYSTIFLTNSEMVSIDGNRSLKPLKEPTYRCDQQVINSAELEPVCQCTDCPASCLEMKFDVSYIEKIGSITVTEFMIIGLALTVLVAFAFVVIHNKLQRKWENKSLDEASANLYWDLQNRLSNWLYTLLSDAFHGLGIVCSLHPAVTVVMSVLCCVVLSVGMTHFQATADPIDLWGMINGRCMREKQYFDEHFGPFYRTTQIILVPKNQTPVEYRGKAYGPVFRQELLLESLDIQMKVRDVVAQYGKEKITLGDVCFAPLSPDNKECTIQDVSQYFQNDKDKMLKPGWMDHLLHCIDAYYSTECLSVYLAPIFPYVAFGGVPAQKDYEKSTALSFVLLNLNHLVLDFVRIVGERLEKVKLWEAQFLRFMGNLTSDNFDIYYNAERSAEDGVESIGEGDVSTVLISYFVMFAYMSIFLSTFRGLSTLLVDIRISLGFSCILMIAMSLTSSFGLFSFCGYKTSLVVLEVTPFLILAVGSGDNFIFVKNFVALFDLASMSREDDKPGNVEAKVALNLRQIGPSLLLSSCAQVVAFGIGAIIPVSSVRMFALYSTFAVIVKFCLQVTFFVAVFTLDTKRQLQNRLDVLCCVQPKKANRQNVKHEILFQKIFRKFYSPVILNSYARPIILILFFAWFIASLVLVPRINIGLNLQVVFPDNSYTRSYLWAFEKYSAVGPPIYMVVKDGYPYDRIVDQNNICGTVSCDSKSLVNRINQAAEYANITYIETPPPSWIDDFFSWISSSACCQINRTSLDFCSKEDPGCMDCPTSAKPYDQRPSPTDFNKYVSRFLMQNPDEICAKAGKALFAYSVELKRNGSINNVGATNFMAYSTVQRSVEDNYKSLEASRYLSDMYTTYLQTASGLPPDKDGVNTVFFYSMIHVYNEQYIGIMNSTLLNLIYSIVGVFIVTLLLLGLDIQSSLITLIIIILTIGELLGTLYIANIDLNAISVVNLVMAMGIVVEFYVHMVRDFSVTVGIDRMERAKSVLNHIGVFIFIGVTIPELVSVATMSTAKSEMFRLYFFKMYLILIITCTLNALVFLPVFLSYIGAPLNNSKLKILNKQFELSKAAEGFDETISKPYELEDGSNRIGQS